MRDGNSKRSRDLFSSTRSRHAVVILGCPPRSGVVTRQSELACTCGLAPRASLQIEVETLILRRTNGGHVTIAAGTSCELLQPRPIPYTGNGRVRAFNVPLNDNDVFDSTSRARRVAETAECWRTDASIRKNCRNHFK